MEKNDEELILSLIADNEELKAHWEEHVALEKQLVRYNRRLHLSTQEEADRKELQKRKLAGKDRIMQILAHHRAASGEA